MKKFFFSLICASALSSSGAFAKRLELVREHSKIAFSVDYMTLTKVEGQFKKYSGFYDLNEQEDAISNVKVAIEAGSVDSSDLKRDFHLKGMEFFFVAEYPEMEFVAKGPVTISTGGKFNLPGEFTMRGVTKPLTLEGLYQGKMKDPWNKESYFFTFTGEINRKDFGMVWNKTMDSGGFLVGDVVRLNVVVQSQMVGSKTEFSTHMVPNTKGIQERADLKKGKIKKLSTPTGPKSPGSK